MAALFSHLCILGFILCVYRLDCVRAVPQYFVEEHCSQTLALNYGSIEAVRLHLTRAQSYPDRMACAMRVQAPQGKRLRVSIQTFDVVGVPDLMCQTGDYIQMADGPSEQAAPLPGLTSRVCARPMVERYDTTGPYLVLRFMSDADRQAGSGISLLITAFNDGPCNDSQFQCASGGSCIQKTLMCDGYNNCPDSSDEAMPMCLSQASIIIIVVVAVLFVIAIVVLVVGLIVRNQRMKRARIIKRALTHERLSNSLWCEPKARGIDMSQIDPIWDGGASSGLQDADTRSRLSINSFHSNESTVTSYPYATISGSRSMSTRRILSEDDDDSDQAEVPSSFWDIQIKELMLVANQLNADAQSLQTTQTGKATLDSRTTNTGKTTLDSMSTNTGKTTFDNRTTHTGNVSQENRRAPTVKTNPDRRTSQTGTTTPASQVSRVGNIILDNQATRSGKTTRANPANEARKITLARLSQTTY